MLHLLTEEHRQKVVREYRKRVLVVFFLGLFFVSIVSLIFIMPTFFLSYSRYSDLKVKTQALDSELSLKEDPSSSENIKNITTSIEVLRMFDKKKSIYSILDGLIKGKPVGVQIKNIIFSPNGTETMTIDIAGRADTRKSLVSFDQNVKSNPLFSEVLIPLGSFAKEKNIDFSMKLIVSSSTVNTEIESGNASSVQAVEVSPSTIKKQTDENQN